MRAPSAACMCTCIWRFTPASILHMCPLNLVPVPSRETSWRSAQAPCSSLFSHTAPLADRRLGLDEMVEERSIARRAATLAAAAAGGGAAGAPHQPQQQHGSRLPPQSAGPEHGQPPQPHGQARYGGEQFGDQQCALPRQLRNCLGAMLVERHDWVSYLFRKVEAVGRPRSMLVRLKQLPCLALLFQSHPVEKSDSLPLRRRRAADALLTGLAQGRSSHELATALAAAGAPQQQHQHFVSGLHGQGDPFQVAGCLVSLVSRFPDLFRPSIGHWSRCNQGGCCIALLTPMSCVWQEFLLSMAHSDTLKR